MIFVLVGVGEKLKSVVECKQDIIYKMENRWTFRKDSNHKWYLIPYDLVTVFLELSSMTDVSILADEFDNYLVDDIQEYIFDEPIRLYNGK